MNGIVGNNKVANGPNIFNRKSEVNPLYAIFSLG
jgi:hypothetical protein